MVQTVPHGPRWVCCLGPDSCYNGRAGASFLAAVAETPGRHVPAAAASAVSLTDAALPAACVYTP